MDHTTSSPTRRRRPRRYLPPLVLKLLRPAFRHSYTRDAYVLRGVGNRFGPVLKPSHQRASRELRTH